MTPFRSLVLGLGFGFGFGLGFCAATRGASARDAGRVWSQGDPSPDEQFTMEWINAARADPVGTLNRLVEEAPGDPVLSGWFAAELPATPAQLSQNLQTAITLAKANAVAFPSSAAIDTAPLAFYPAFQQEAEAYAAAANLPAPAFPAGRAPPAYYYPPIESEILLSGVSDTFTGPNATGGTAVFGPYGADYAELSEADLYDPALTGREYALELLCQPGSGSPPPAFLAQGDPLPGLTLGHTRLAGIALAPAAGGGRTLGFFRASSEFLTQSDLPYGPAGTVFITGVAYRDQNGNGAYDPGEGIGGVAVTLDHGGWSAVTASAGGYAIPVPANSGVYTATADGGPFSGATAAVTVGSDNVKLDWVLPAMAATLPPQQPVPPPAGSCQLVNLSGRGLVEEGANALIAGFVIAGPPGAAKRLLIRGVGPSLQTVGVAAADCVPATETQLFGPGGGLVATNAGWTSSPDGGAAVAQAAAQSGAFPLVAWAGGGGDSAMVVNLAPGAYTVVVTPGPGAPSDVQSGRIGLVELYDLSPNSGGTLVNLSCRGAAGSGAATLTLGLTVGGTGQARLLLRAAGPALAAFGVSPVLMDPALALLGPAGQTLATDAGWSDTAQTDQIAILAAQTGAFGFPAGSADSALIALAAPGSYTAQVSAATGAAPQGIALVEVYSSP